MPVCARARLTCRTVAAVALLAAAAALTLAPRADAYIWWGHNFKGHGIGRAELDGTDVRPDFIPRASGFYAFNRNVAADGTHVYFSVWGEGSVSGGPLGTPTLGRANSDGTGVDYHFGPGGSNVLGLGVSASHVYWTTTNSNGTGSVVRMPIGGGGTESVTSATGEANPTPCGVTTDGTYVYWANLGTYSIARAKLSTFGTLSDVEGQFVPLGTGVKPCGIAVTSAAIYWGVYRTNTTGHDDLGTSIGRANINGTGPDNNFIPGVYGVNGLSISGNYLYWSSEADSTGDGTKGSIGRAGLNGGGAQPMISNLELPWGVAVDPSGTTTPPPPPIYHPPPELPPVFDPNGSHRTTPPPAPPDFSRVWTTNTVFKPAPTSTPLNGYSIGAKTARAVPTGTTFNFIANRPGKVTISINLIGTGRRSGRVCRPASRKLAKKPRCTRLVKLYTLTRTARVAGRNSVPFTGRVKGRALRPGRYRAIFTGVAGKKTSKAKHADFRIVRG